LRHAHLKYRQSSVKGLTFLEIMIVVTILSVIVAISSPSLKNMYQKQQLHAAARQIGAMCKYARAAAIMQEGETKIQFDVESARFRLKLPEVNEEELEAKNKRNRGRYREMKDQKPATVERYRYLPPDVEFYEILTEAPEELEQTQWNTGVVYYQNGAATPCFVILQNRRGRKITVEVQHSTGAVRIYTGEPVFEEPGTDEFVEDNSRSRGYTGYGDYKSEDRY
jgi:prepilin-type N-terminal cleavage/methylation domain-containing protein